MSFKHLSLALGVLATGAQAASNDQWAQRSLYQIITDRYARPLGASDATCNITNYCGGTWEGIVEKLDYIQNMGFTAVQISPAQRNLNSTTIYGQAFHGYWIQDLYDLNANFGTAADLKNLSAELHKRDMYLLVDVVANEMAYDIGDANMTSSTPVDYSVFNPFNTQADYNPFCPITDWSNVTMYENCWLGTEGVITPRLRNQDQKIANVVNQFVHDFVANYSIDGIRIDGAKQVDPGFFQPFISAAGVYAMSEVDDGDAASVCAYQNTSAGLENYPLYYPIIQAFTAGNMSGLVNMIGQVRNECKSPQYLATFIENQDNPRFASQVRDIALAANAMSFTILADGIPKIYYGQEQHLSGNYSPFNRQPLWDTDYDMTAPLYNLTASLNKLRNHAIVTNNNYVTNMSEILYTDNSTYAARKGPNGVQIVQVLSNQGSNGGKYQLSVPGAADPGTNMTEIFSCEQVTAGQNGTIVVDMGAGAPKVFFPSFNLNGSGICGTANKDSGTPGATVNSSSGSSGSSGSGSGSGKKGAAEHLRVPISTLLGLGGVFAFALL